MTLKIKIDKRDYSEYQLYHSGTHDKIDSIQNFYPAQHKLFNDDVFTYSENEFHLVHSVIRSSKYIPGVVTFKKSFGNYKKKKLYKCIPDDKRLPIFLVPYTIKLGFSKKIDNIYVVFQFSEWENKHPLGKIMNTFGPTCKLKAFYEYEMYCKSLYASITSFSKNTMKALKRRSQNEYISDIFQKYEIEDRTHFSNIYSIDPENSKDFDDAFHILKTGDETYLLSIYIANVTVWLDILDVWDSFSERVSTIYLPDRKRPMLPTILSDALCSLQEQEIRFAFCLDLDIENGKIVDHSFHSTGIKVCKNLRYDTKEMLKTKEYKHLIELTNILNRAYKYGPNIKSCHQAVAYIMILMNCFSAKKLLELKGGIYRILHTDYIPPKNLPSDIHNFVKGWHSSGGKYVSFDSSQKADFNFGHDILELDSYVHITSPIRRLVDLLNMTCLMDGLGILPFSEKSRKFYNYWLSRIDYINKTMKSIRRIQNDCALLNKYSENPDLLCQEYSGFLFDKMCRNDGLYQYTVYIPEFKLVLKYVSNNDYDSFYKGKFKIYCFMSENRLKHKIRLEMK